MGTSSMPRNSLSDLATPSLIMLCSESPLSPLSEWGSTRGLFNYYGDDAEKSRMRTLILKLTVQIPEDIIRARSPMERSQG
jgi:hypothetical protein